MSRSARSLPAGLTPKPLSRANLAAFNRLTERARNRPAPRSVASAITVALARSKASTKSAGKKPKTGDAFSEILTTMKASLKRPAVVLMLLVSLAFIISHDDNTGPIHTLCSDSTSGLCKFAKAQTDKIFGLVIFSVAAWDSPRSMSAQVFIAAILWVIMIPAPGILAYCLQAVLLHTFLWVRSDAAKLITLLLIGFAYGLGYIPLFGTVPKTL